MKHPLSGKIVKPYDEPNRFLPSHVNDVLPAVERLRFAIPLDDLELEPVHVEWMVHADQVLDLPDLRCAQLRGVIHASEIEVAVVDHSLAERDDAPGGDA